MVPLKKLEADLVELEIAYESASWESSYHLDLETGRVIWIREETEWELERVFEEVHDPESDEPVNLAEVLPR